MLAIISLLLRSATAAHSAIVMHPLGCVDLFSTEGVYKNIVRASRRFVMKYFVLSATVALITEMSFSYFHSNHC